MLVMVLAVVAMIVLPVLVTNSAKTRDVGLTGSVPAGLSATIEAQADGVGTTAHVYRYGDPASGQEALRSGRIDVLVVDGRRLEWPRRADEKLKAVVVGAIQLVAVRERAASAGVDPDALLALVAPVRVTNLEHSSVAGRTAGDETMTIVMTGVLLLTISIYGGLVLSGVVEEKSSRVVEVLLARMPARSLLTGKIVGIGLLGLAQVGVTAAAALVAVSAVGSLEVPVIRGEVLAWTVAWFVLGYALYATLFGALGSLASRPEDAQSVAGPAMMVMVASYFAAFFLTAQADGPAARAVSLFPTVSPLFMPARIALGAAAWWEPVVAVAITLATVVVLIRLGGRLYENAILHGGPTLSLRDAWRATPASGARASHRVFARLHRARTSLAGRSTMSPSDRTTHRRTVLALVVAGVVLGIVVAALTADVIIGVIAGAGFIALTVQSVKLWSGGDRRRPRHP
jgi:ABC-2 type transport system permease protein